MVECRNDADGVERLVWEWQSGRILNLDVNASPGKHVGAETESMSAGEVVVPAAKVEEAPSDKGQHHAQSPWFEKVHPARFGFVLSLLRLPLDEVLRIEVDNLRACALVDHDAQSSTARKTCVVETCGRQIWRTCCTYGIGLTVS